MILRFQTGRSQTIQLWHACACYRCIWFAQRIKAELNSPFAKPDPKSAAFNTNGVNKPTKVPRTE